MRTKNLRKCKSGQVGYKIVTPINGETCSWYANKYVWKKGVNIAWGPENRHRIICEKPDGIFHCFSRKKDAKRFCDCENKNRVTVDFEYKLIKIILTGKVFKGKINEMGKTFDNLPAICGSKAIWDGKFIN